MPNDCCNNITISHSNRKLMVQLEQSLQQDPPSFLATFLPCPDCTRCTKYWGTKWDVYDVQIQQSLSGEDRRDAGNVVEASSHWMSVSFYTAWSPPCNAYQKLQDMGFLIEAQFMESGGDFCGYWNDGKYIIYENVHDNKDNVPEEFHSYFFDEEDEEADADNANDTLSLTGDLMPY